MAELRCGAANQRRVAGMESRAALGGFGRQSDADRAVLELTEIAPGIWFQQG